MRLLRILPVLTYLLVLYDLLALLGASIQLGLKTILLSITLPSGSALSLNLADLFIVLGIIGLAIEVVKATRSAASSILDHGLSTLIFVVFLVEFIVLPAAGTPTFLILTLMALLDVITGFTVTISTARRDIAVDHFPGE